MRRDGGYGMADSPKVPGGVLAGTGWRTYDSLRLAVFHFASLHKLEVGLFKDGDTWFVRKG